MFEKRNDPAASAAPVHPLKLLTKAEFAALGGDAVAFIRALDGASLSQLVHDSRFEGETEYHLVMSADGTPLMVADTQEAVFDWLSEQTLGLATLH